MIVPQLLLAEPAEVPTSSATLGHVPLMFEQNVGQTDKSVRFLVRATGYTLFLRPQDAIFALSRPAAGHNTADNQQEVLRMSLIGASHEALDVGMEPTGGHANYLVGSEAAAWKKNVELYRRARFQQVYPGVDLVYYGNQSQLEYDFQLAPGARPGDIRVRFEGVRDVAIAARGELLLQLAGGTMQWKAPVAYQMIHGHRREVSVRYAVNKGLVSFRLGRYDRSQPLIIDPVLAYGTYLGVADNSMPSAIAVDSAGNVYLAGVAYSSAFPVTAGAYQTTQHGNGDVFVTKLNASGTGLIFSTYVGGSQNDSASGISLDANGNAYVVGNTLSTDFPATPGALHLAGSDGTTGYVFKLNAYGSVLEYSALLGGNTARAVAVDSLGQTYITGAVFAGPFQLTSGAYKTTIGTTNCPNVRGESYVMKLNDTASAPLYSTYIADCEQAYGIAVDQGGFAYITGQTENHHPVTIGAPQLANAGYIDTFVTKLNTDGSGLVYSTFLGGALEDAGNGIAVDSAGNAYTAGLTTSSNYPHTANAAQPVIGAPGSTASDAFLTKLDPAGNLAYSTFLGGSQSDFANAVSLDAAGNIYIAGEASSADFPTVNAVQGICGQSAGTLCPSSAFVAKFTNSGSLSYATFYGPPTTWDVVFAATADAAGNAYITGISSSGLPTSANAYEKATPGTSGTVFAAKISALGPTGCTYNRADRTVSICQPFLDTTVTSPVRVVALVNDSLPLIASQIYVDGNIVLEQIGPQQLDSYVSIPPGSHTLAVKGWDSNGAFLTTRVVNVSGAATIGCSAGDVLPYVQVCGPTANTTVGMSISLSAIGISDNNPVTTMRVYVDNAATYTVYSNRLQTPLSLSPGRHRVTAQGWDYTGRAFNQSVYVTAQ